MSDPLLRSLGLSPDALRDGDLIARSPIDGTVLARVRSHTPADIDAAIARAHLAFHRWRTVPAPRRGELVRLLGEELRANKAALGALVTLETGKIAAEGEGEVQEMIDICDFAVGLSRQLHGLTIASERPGHRMMETWHPLGVTGVISAFNFPVAVWAWNFALALVCGNPVVWKPSEKTPLSALACQALFRRALLRWGEAPEGLSELLIGARAAGDLRRVRQHLLQARPLDHRDGVLGEHRMGGHGRVHAVGENIGRWRIRRDIAGRVAGQRIGRDLRLARGAGDVGEAVGIRRGDDFLQHVEGIHRDHLQTGAGQAGEQGRVVGGRQLGAGGLRHGALRAEARGQPEIGDVEHHHVAGAGTLQLADQTNLGGHGRADGGGRVGARGDGEQVVCSAPHRVQRIRIGLAAGGRQIVAHLRGQRRHRAERAGRIHRHARATGCVIAASLAIAVGLGFGAVVIGQVLRPHPARIGGELAGHRLHAGRQKRTVEARIGQAVAEEHGVAERSVGQGRRGSQCQRQCQQMAGGTGECGHGVLSEKGGAGYTGGMECTGR